MERSVTSHNNNKSVNDDLSPEEVADIKEFYSNKAERKKFGTVEELIKDLNS